ncbi:MAG: phosphotransferase [Pseudomonadota bacterium]
MDIQEIAAHWGKLSRQPRLVRDRENAIYEVHLSSGLHAALRVHRAGYQSAEAIKAELDWTAALAEGGFPCPRPVASLDGSFVHQTAAGRSVSVVTWIEADPIGANGTPFTGPLELYEKAAALMARLHEMSNALKLPQLDRPSWASDALLGETPHWGRFWENPALTPDNVQLLQTARKNAAQHLSVRNDPVRLIHADLLQENILQNQTGLWIIDFDDSGYGYEGYDLGTLLIQHAESDRLEALCGAVLKGYAAQRGSVTLHMHDLQLFIMLRSMASCGWIMSRASESDPRQAFYAGRAVRCATRYLDNM